MHRQVPCSGAVWTHRSGEPVPAQLAGHLDDESWTQFLTEIDTSTPKPSVFRFAGVGGFLLGFLLTYILAKHTNNESILPVGWVISCVSIIAMFGYDGYVRRKIRRCYREVVNRHRQTMAKKHIKLSFESVTEGYGTHRRVKHFLQLLVIGDAALPGGLHMQQISVTVPPGVVPLSQIIVHTPAGNQVSVVVPAACLPGSTFQVKVPLPITPVAQAAAVPEEHVTVIDTGGWFASGYRPAKSMVIAKGEFLYDFSGDGIMDATGYDTTDGGKIDTTDTTDVIINTVIHKSNVATGNRIGKH